MEKILEKVSMDIDMADEKLESAKYLLKGEFYRDCVSRAYYSMFHAAKAILFLKGVEPKTHKGVLRMFGLHLVKEADVDIYLGKALSYAREVREDSDYGVSVSISKEMAESILNDAELFIKKIKEVIEEFNDKASGSE